MKHMVTMTATRPGEPTVYRAICGYESTNAKEFTNPMTGTWAQVSCEKCLEKQRLAVSN